MAKKKRRKQQPQGRQARPKQPVSQPVERAVPKFEIGVKGDEFDIAYTRAAAAEKQKVDALMAGFSRQSRKNGLNLLNFAILSLLILLMASSFAFLSRSGNAPALRAEKLANGSYLSELSEYYNSTLPFGRALRTLGAALGFGDTPEPEAETEEPTVPDEPEPPAEPAVTTAATEPEVTTTVPATTETPTSAPITEETEATEPETHTMYANATVNIRLEPSVDSMIMGYFNINEPIEVVALRTDGWAMIWYNGMYVYVHSDYLGKETVRTTRKTTAATTTTTEAAAEEITTVPEDAEPETTPDATDDTAGTDTPEATEAPESQETSDGTADTAASTTSETTAATTTASTPETTTAAAAEAAPETTPAPAADPDSEP